MYECCGAKGKTQHAKRNTLRRVPEPAAQRRIGASWKLAASSGTMRKPAGGQYGRQTGIGSE